MDKLNKSCGLIRCNSQCLRHKRHRTQVGPRAVGMRHAGGKELSFKFICSSDASETAPEVSASSSQVISVSAYLSAPRMHKRLKSRHVMDVLRSRICDRSFEPKLQCGKLGQNSRFICEGRHRPIPSRGPLCICRLGVEVLHLRNAQSCKEHGTAERNQPHGPLEIPSEMWLLYFLVGHILYLLIY